MKKILSIFVILFMCFILPSCDLSGLIGNNQNNDKEYSITFISQNTILELDLKSYTSGVETLLPVLDDNDLYHFEGWYTSPNYTGEVVTKILSSDFGDKTFYAKWEELNSDITTYQITFISFGKELDLGISNYESGKKVILPVLEDTDSHSFEGWYLDSNYSGKEVTEISELETGDKTFYAKWEEVTSTLDNELKEALKNLNSYAYTFSYRDDDTSGDYSYTNSYEFYNNSIKVPYEYDGMNYVDYLIYDQANDSYTYYYADSVDSYTVYFDDDPYFDYVIAYVDYAYLDLIDPNNYELIEGKWVAKNDKINEEATNILNGYLDGETFDSVVITLNNGYISNIVITSTVDSVDYGLYHTNMSIDFSKFGEVSFDKPNTDIGPIETEFTVKDAYEAYDNETVTVIGAIYAQVGNNYYLRDETHGIYLYLASSSVDLEIGDVVKVTGTKTTFNGLVELVNLSSVQLMVDEEMDISPVELEDLSMIDEYMSMNLNLQDLIVVSLPSSYSKDIKLYVSDGENSVMLFASSYTKNREEFIDFVQTLSIGDTIDLSNVVVGCYNNAQLVITEQTVFDYAYEGEVILEEISTNKSTLNVINGTTLEEAMESVIVYKDFSNGTRTIAHDDEYSYSCENYNGEISGSYQVIIKLDSFETIITINVKEASVVSKPEEGTVDLLENIASSFGVTRGMPSTGDVKALVIPVEFTNYKANSTMKQDLEITFFGTSEQTGWESLSSYYYKASYGKLNITGTVLDVYNTGKTSTYYSNLYNNGQDADYEIIRSALEYYDDSVNYADYDSDKDGYIDALYIIYTAPVDYEADDSMWWAYTYEYYTDDYEYYDGVEADFYFFAGYEFMFENPACGKNLKYNAETFIHETGHMLGLDDYYDYDASKGPDGGIGGGDMMDYNVGDHNPFTKIILGWTTPYIVTDQNTTMTLSSFGESGDCILICKEWNGTYFDEYYIIDYYTPDGLNAFEAGYSGLFSTDGIRIYHIDAKLKTTEVYSIWEVYQSNNSDTAHKLISLIQASGSNSIENENDYSSNTDLFKEKDTFTNAKWYDGSSCGFTIIIDDISNDTATITITF